MVTAYINYSTQSIDTFSYYSAQYFVDLYGLAGDQKESRGLELLSTYLICLYSLKYFQFIESIQPIFEVLKKSSFEYLSLLVTICVVFLGLSILTNFVFGSYIYEYKTFAESVLMNIKIFIFIENTAVTAEFLKFYRVFSIIILIIFIFLIRYFFLNLFYPIFIEYYRIEIDKQKMASVLKKSEADQAQEGYTFSESKHKI